MSMKCTFVLLKRIKFIMTLFVIFFLEMINVKNTIFFMIVDIIY